MTIAYVATSSALATGSTSLSVAYPAGLSSGNIILLCVVNKYPTNGPSTPSGFTLLAQSSGGAGSAGADAGDVYTTVFYKVSDGTESGSITVTVTSANSACARMFAYSKTNSAWDLASATGTDTSAGTQYRITYGSDPGVASGDFAVVFSGMNGTGTTYGTNTITQTGITFGTVTERHDGGTTTGDNCLMVVTDASASSGTSSAAPQSGCNSSSSFSSYPAGAAIFVRLREVAGGTTYTQSLSGGAARSASLSSIVAFKQSLAAGVAKSATFAAMAVFFQSLSSAISKAASIATQYIDGEPPLLAAYRNVKSVIQSVVQSVIGKK